MQHAMGLTKVSHIQMLLNYIYIYVCVYLFTLSSPNYYATLIKYIIYYK